MKRILVLTDFSAKAAHAAVNAVYLSEKLQTGLLLYNSYQSTPVTPHYAGGPFVPGAGAVFKEENDREMSKLADRLKEQMSSSELAFRPSISHLSGEGDLANNLQEILRQKNIELIVMGARSGVFFDHLLNGSHTQSVIDHTGRPVIIIPPGANLQHLKKVIFATDYKEGDIHAVGYLISMAMLFNFKIEVVHVSVMEEKTGKHSILSEIEFKRFINELKYPGISYRDIRGKEIIPRLNRYCTESGADMLAMVHYRHGFFSDLFIKSPTKRELENQGISILILPSKFM